MLKLKDITFAFRKKSIFENVNIDFQPGRIYGIVGANGVGKTTFFRSIAGFYQLNQGEIHLNDKHIRPSEVSLLPTAPFFYPYMKGMEYLKITHKEKDQLSQSTELSNILNIPLENLVDTYSTGMKKKLAFIARYAQNKPVSIYDEPFNGVDLESNEVLLKLLRKNKTNQITIISSHILSSLFELCDEIIHIEEGFAYTHYQKDQFQNLQDKIRSKI